MSVWNFAIRGEDLSKRSGGSGQIRLSEADGEGRSLDVCVLDSGILRLACLHEGEGRKIRQDGCQG